jgi:hypothetical protein
MKICIYSILITAGIVLSSCDKIFLSKEIENNPINNFDDLWNSFDEMYGGFELKNINWDSVYSVYRPMLNENSTDEELYIALIGMLDVLNDNHVCLIPANSNLDAYQSGILGRLKTFSDFKEATVSNQYLVDRKTIGNTIVYGKLDYNIGYIHLSNFDETKIFFDNAFEEILEYLNDTRGLVIDIRNNKGGADLNSVFVAGHFTEEEQVAFKFRLKNGMNHNDFTPFTDYWVKPEGTSQYLKPTVLLTHRFSISAAETFTLTMSLFDNVTIVGDTTSGAFSDAIMRELPNAWLYAISIGDWRSSAGVSYEGIGYPPDIVVQNDSTDVANGIDSTLDNAINILK